MPEPPEPIRILLVDDHALFREGLARYLGSEAGFRVVGECGSAREAVALLRETCVDIVLLDFDLGDGDGTEFMRSARREGFGGPVLVVTAGVEETEAADLIRAGVAGIFPKHKSAALLARAISDVAMGRVWFEQNLLQDAITRGARPAPEAGRQRFTPRERQVFSCVLEGLANKQIAGRVGVSESSVKATLQQLFSKTGVRTRSQLVRVALEHHRDLATEPPSWTAPGPHAADPRGGTGDPTGD